MHVIFGRQWDASIKIMVCYSSSLISSQLMTSFPAQLLSAVMSSWPLWGSQTSWKEVKGGVFVLQYVFLKLPPSVWCKRLNIPSTCLYVVSCLTPPSVRWKVKQELVGMGMGGGGCSDVHLKADLWLSWSGLFTAVFNGCDFWKKTYDNSGPQCHPAAQVPPKWF